MNPMMRIFMVGICLVLVSICRAEPKFIQTPYTEQKVVFDFYLDEPDKIGPALYWVRALLNPLMERPYSYAPEFLEIVVIIHGTEIVTVAKKNQTKYQANIERMRYYADLGVKFKVCNLAMDDYGYELKDMQDFVEVVPSAITELAHWQLQGFAVIRPIVVDKKYSIDEIR